ncbi:uncharacterized protein LOC119095634 isoform X2 [Pollicipes pollicipes]|uniref:uncharacterized protein LOC119095634 isoform X2 n=1 Tax=Pollicipes pollicipes TaxID=41117 RepID=UPI001885896A|nr:uncharacterized protein LOC119095634 isoform X2 [Pollicipes pollicipes]
MWKHLLFAAQLVVSTQFSSAASGHSKLTKPWQMESFAERLRGHNAQNLTYSETAAILRARGYKVKEFKGEPPLVMIADTAHLPEQVMPQLSQDRFTGIISSNNLWKDERGSAQCWYFFDTESRADKNVFKAAVKTWSDKSCIKFNKIPDGPCTQKVGHGAICVGDYGGCFSFVGNIYKEGGTPQKMSVQPNGCEMVAAAHEFGHALGNQHQQSRPDRDLFMFVNNENFEVSVDKSKRGDALSNTWAQGGRCAKDQVVDLPVPYDYMSLMQYATTAFADDDLRPIFVSTDGHYQYILDYHRKAGMAQSHYDMYALNTVYGCDKLWAASCRFNGKHVPKCTNMGFLTKDCTCQCPREYTGETCDTKAGPTYPILAKAKVMIDVRKSQKIYLGTKTFVPDRGDAVLDNFKYFQFFTVIADGDTKTQVSINIKQSAYKSRFFLSRQSAFFIIRNIHFMDCQINLFWGLSKKGQLRTECLSSVANNEPDGPMFNSRSSHLDMIYRSSIGYSLGDPKISITLMQLQLDVVFAPKPDKVLKLKKAASSGGSNGGNSTGGNGTDPGASSMIGAGAGVGLGVGLTLLVLLLIVCIATALIARRKRQLAAMLDPDAMLDNIAEHLGDSSDSTSTFFDDTTDSDDDDKS